MWEDELLQTYITELGQRLVAVASPRPFRYRFRVVNDPTVNAFTWGGGLIYVNGGLIARVENEAQLAMVFAHEIAHVTERHIPEGIEQAWQDEMLGAAVAEALQRTGTLEGEALEVAYEYSMSAVVNGQGRAQESEADVVGLEYLAKAGYNPLEAPKAFEAILKEHGDPPPLVTFFWSDHPSTASRIKRTREIVNAKYSDPPATRTVNTEEFKRRTRQIVVAMGVLDYEARRFGTAKAMFEKAAPISEDDPLPHYYLGKIILETSDSGEVDEAINHLLDSVQADGGFAPTYRELGLAYYRLRDRQKAIDAFERYLALAPAAEDAELVETYIRELTR